MRKFKYGAIGVMLLGAMLVLQGCVLSTKVSEKVTERSIENQLGGEADVDINDDGTATYKTEQGTVSTENKVPESWPKDAPIYADAKILISGENTDGQKGLSLSLSSPASVDKIFDYYSNELKNQGWKIVSTSKSTYGNVITAEKDTRTFSLVILGSDSTTQITTVIAFEAE